MDETPLYAQRGFSANGIDCVRGQDVTGLFDAQVETKLIEMGRIGTKALDPELPLSTETRDVAEPGKAGKTGKATAPALPGALPGT